MKKRLLFIVNPVAGIHRHVDFRRLVQKKLDTSQFQHNIRYTEYPGHATELTEEAIRLGVDIVVAVGGDGTVNEIGRALIGTKTALAIIPRGSGNGLARHLGLPISTKKALKRLNKGQKRSIDTVQINGHPYLGIAGIGFDAEVSHRFAKYSHRGLAGYLRAALDRFLQYKPLHYTLCVDGATLERDAFLISFANTSQYGNNAQIAPGAHEDDGYLDLTILHRFPHREIPRLSYELFHGRLGTSRHIERIPCKAVRIEHPPSPHLHIDGEPITIEGPIEISLVPSSLSVIT